MGPVAGMRTVNMKKNSENAENTRAKHLYE